MDPPLFIIDFSLPKGSSINNVTHRRGKKIHDIVTTRDVKGRGKRERLRDVTLHSRTNVASAARPGQTPESRG